MSDQASTQSAKRSLAELDDVIEEIIHRNPDWVAELRKLIEDKKNNHFNLK